MKLFMEQGYEKTTTRQILDRVGILNGSLYNIYHSKEDIFADLMMSSMDELMNAGANNLPPNSSEADFMIYFSCFQIHLASKSPHIAELLCIANRNWSVRSDSEAFIYDWYTIIPTKYNPEEHALIVYSISGMVSTFLSIMQHDPGRLNDRNCMRYLINTINHLYGRTGDVDMTLEFLMASFAEKRIIVRGVDLLEQS